MPLPPGSRVGAYEIKEPIGAGGMGVVYRAHDAKLNRDVALKVLPEALSTDAARVARLRREAQVLASLNHPHIGSIYGLEDGDHIVAMVLELVDGPTLADRIAAGRIPVAEAIAIAKQIAEALVAAHEQGIIHRDLKPGNIKLRPDGTVKVLDFGLAKAVDPSSSSQAAAQLATVTASSDSLAGAIRGTPAYMSPEQASGSSVDRRTDIWAFGLVVLEMLTGERTFTGESSTHVLAAVLREEPDWSRLPPDTPPTMRRLLQRCLVKDRKRRLDSAAVARFELDDTSTAREELTPAPAHRGAIGMVVAAGVLGAIVTAGIAWSITRPSTVAAPAPVRFTILTPPDLFLRPSLQASGPDFAIAPDGSFLVYQAGRRGELAMRWFDRLEVTTFAGVTGASMPFVSPDSKWIGFVQDDLTLKKIPVTGGAPVTLAVLPVWPRGASWVDLATIIVGTHSESMGLLRVPAGGGEPVALTTPDRAHGEEGHVLPSSLPGGGAVLFTIGAAEPANARIAVLDLESRKITQVLQGGRDAQYVASGHMVYLAGRGLSAVRFDLDRRATIGDPVRVLDGIAAAPTSALNVAVTAAGTMVFTPAQSDAPTLRVLAWVDREGRETPIAAPPRPYESARLSPDGTRVAVSILDQENDIWTWSLARQTLTRVTFDPDVDRGPVWTPDGRRLVFTSARAGAYNLYARDVDGAAPDVRLTHSANTQVPNSITADGTSVIAHEVRPHTKSDLARFQLGSSAPPEDLVNTPYEEWNGEVSPDGRFLAYQSEESGQAEVYVRPFPKASAVRWQVSPSGGTEPVWTRGGRELVYLDAAHRLTAVSVDASGGTFQSGPPAMLVKTAYAAPLPWRSYDVSPDGQRFLVMKTDGKPLENSQSVFVVIQHWFEELRRLVPPR